MFNPLFERDIIITKQLYVGTQHIFVTTCMEVF